MAGRRGRPPKQATNKYDAAGNGRRIAKWSPPASGPNRALTGLTKLRSRALDSVRNDWSGESGVQKWTTALIGTGIVPRWADESLNTLWSRWTPVADADGVLDLYGMQALVVRSWMAAGEVFARRRPRVLGTRFPVPLQVQLVESDYCPLFDADQRAGMPAGNRIRQGVEFTPWGQRVAYWMHREHPGDNTTNVSESDLLRVPATEVIHVFEPKRPGQVRGVSNLAPVLVRLRNVGDFEDAVLDRQKLANLFTLFITRAMPDSWEDLDLDPDTGLPKFYDTDGSPMASLEPGLSQQLAPGEDVKFANPPATGVGFSDYMRTTALGTAAGQGLPYELFSGDIANVSDRTLRIVIQEFRRFAEQRQWHVVIPQFCQGVVNWWAEAGVLSGAIPLSKLDKAKAPEHSPHGWEYIHPVQDVQGKVLAIEAGLSSRTRAITARGDDPKKIDQERADDKAREDKLGLTPPPPPEPGGKPPKPAQTQEQEQEQQGKPANNEFAQVLATLGQMMGSMQALMAQLANAQNAAPAPAPAAPSVTLHNYLPAAADITVEPPVVHINNQVEPTPVSVTNHVAPTPVEVTNNVAAPNVSVAAPTVQVTNEVQPADVVVSLPTRKTETTIVRDEAGNIARTTQVEKTVKE